MSNEVQNNGGNQKSGIPEDVWNNVGMGIGHAAGSDKSVVAAAAVQTAGMISNISAANKTTPQVGVAFELAIGGAMLGAMIGFTIGAPFAAAVIGTAVGAAILPSMNFVQKLCPALKNI